MFDPIDGEGPGAGAGAGEPGGASGERFRKGQTGGSEFQEAEARKEEFGRDIPGMKATGRSESTRSEPIGSEPGEYLREEITEVRYSDAPRHERAMPPVEVVGVTRSSNASGKRLSWGAIFAGFFVAIGVQLLLGLLGIAIGMSAWSPGSGNAGDRKSVV
jgi:hypothetical protein